MKYFIMFFIFFAVLIQANSFSDGMRAYRKGDYIQAKTLFLIALEKEQIYNASHLLGKIYLNGNGVDIDLDKAINYFDFAYKFGNISAGCYASSARIDNGIYNWGILENGLYKGLKRNVPYCLGVVDKWQNK